LEGILRSQSFRAFHYQSLNDLTEVEHMRDRLNRKAFSIVNHRLREWRKESNANSVTVKKAGGLHQASQEYANNMVDSFYRAAISPEDGREPFSEPYIVSFCAHTDDDEYVQENGLLSMWRGYGPDGGFALEIDTKEYWKWIEAGEEVTFDYGQLGLGQVIYDNATEDEVFTEFEGIVEAFSKFIEDELAGKTSIAGDIYTPFISAVTRYKHQGFAEESEVRLVAAPLSQRILDAALEKVPDQVTKLKQVEYLKTVDPQRPFLTIRGDPNIPMPVKRIIIGPHHDQNEQEQKVRDLLSELEMRAVVRKSTTPYVVKN